MGSDGSFLVTYAALVQAQLISSAGSENVTLTTIKLEYIVLTCYIGFLVMTP